MAEKVVKVKNTNIKQIFETMEYGKISESTNLSKEWLEKQKKIMHTYTDKKTNICKEKSAEIHDLNNGESLFTIYSPKVEDIPNIISDTVENDLWLKVEAVDRGILLERLAREIERNSTLICQLEVSIRGILSSDTKTKALPLLLEYLQYYASWAVKYKKENNTWVTEGRTTGSIIADDSFLAVFGMVLGPALAAGYHVILQTEPRISLIAALLIEIAENVGLPPGQLKLIPGYIDPSIIFSASKTVCTVSRFGNLHAYGKIAKPLHMNFLAITNGKAPMIVFNNGDLDSACDSVVDAAWGYQGLLPWSVNTVLVQEDIFQTFVDKLKYRLSKVKMGFANDKMADISYPTIISYPSGPKEQLQKVLNEAKLQGIEIYQNDQNSEALQPTLLIGGKLFSNNVILDDKNIPAVTILTFRTTNEAVSLANNSRYGFGASVWTENISLANDVAKKLNVGNVWINTHGNFTAAVPMTAHKESGLGYFGGAEGFFEYIYHTEYLEFNHKIVKSNLPRNTTDNPIQSFYGGSFKKSESGLIDGIYDHPVGKDVQNAIAAAKKGQEAWNKMTILMRSQLLRKVADELNSDTQDLSENWKLDISDWITETYEAIAQIDNLGSLSIQKSYELKSLREAIGVIGAEAECTNRVILGALLLGNSVIILDNYCTNSKFNVELCKIFQLSGIPAGVFNLILNCNADALRTFITHKELNVYFSETCKEYFNKISVKDLKSIICRDDTDWQQILKNATTVKNIWSSVGDSIL